MHRIGGIRSLSLHAIPEGADYPEWSTADELDSLISIRVKDVVIFGSRPTGGYATRWSRTSFTCASSKKKDKKSKDETTETLFIPNTSPECRLISIELENRIDTLHYSSTWSCEDPFCGNKHGHIQYRSEVWTHPKYGIVASRHSPYGRPNNLTFRYSNDAEWTSLLERLAAKIEWEYTNKQARKVKQTLGFTPEL